jgi:DNA-binding GntR family transcriptional regulator
MPNELGKRQVVPLRGRWRISNLAAIVTSTLPRPAASARRPAPRATPAPASNNGSSPAGSTSGSEDDRSDNISRVYQELRSLIIWGQLPPGARIAERAVADRLGMSRTPVRSALHRLQQEGFVASYGRGRDQRLVVTPLTQDDAREIMLIVAHLESLAAHTAASLPSERRKQIVERLRAVNKELASESRRHAAATRIHDLDQEFHRTYVEDVVGPRLLALHRSIKPQIERYTRLYISALVDELPTSVKEHESIVRAIAKGDAAAAQHAVERNWRNAADRLSRVIAQLGERGSWSVRPPARPRRSGRK